MILSSFLSIVDFTPSLSTIIIYDWIPHPSNKPTRHTDRQTGTLDQTLEDAIILCFLTPHKILLIFTSLEVKIRFFIHSLHSKPELIIGFLFFLFFFAVEKKCFSFGSVLKTNKKLNILVKSLEIIFKICQILLLT